MDPLERKPLSKDEKRFPPTTVCVTGGAGYVASHLIARLLVAGHTVHATRRAWGDDPLTIKALDELPGAAARLKWFEADLLQEGSFDDAIAGCEVVFHTAAVVDLCLSAVTGWQRCVVPATFGVANVFGSVERTPSVTKVIMTSSLAAIVDHKPVDHVFTEKDWDVHMALTVGAPYSYLTAKSLSEWQAWALASQQRRWQLVVLNPVNIFGPSFAPRSEAAPTVQLVKKTIDGSCLSFYVPTGMNTVDVRDVAFAHTAAMVNSKAWGRYLLTESSGQKMTDIVALMRKRFPWLKAPHRPLGLWASTVAGLLTKTTSPPFMRLVYNSTQYLSSARAQKELGMEFIPLQTTLEDMVDSFVSCGKLPAEPKDGRTAECGKGRAALGWGLAMVVLAVLVAALAVLLGPWQAASASAVTG